MYALRLLSQTKHVYRLAHYKIASRYLPDRLALSDKVRGQARPLCYEATFSYVALWW